MTQPRITKRRYGELTDGRTVDEYTLDNGRGLSLCAINFGGIVTALNVPDREGDTANVVLGLPDLHGYETRNPNMGTLVGRYANRIAGGRFELDGETFELPRNNGTNTLHGGPVGFGKRWWDIAPLPLADDGSVAIELSLDSADGDQGFPGRLHTTVSYTLTPQDEWRIDYAATTDRATVVNLSQHAYFNLAGQGSILDHRLQIVAARYCPVDANLIPLGIEAVEGTPFDFRAMTQIGARIRAAHPQILLARGYDHNWVLDPAAGAGLRLVARVEEPHSGRAMQVHTDQPGLQFYSGNFLDGTLAGANGQAVRQGDGLCLETQHFPDSPNRSDFPSTVLRPGERYASTTVYRFGLGSP
jgi:aldose 1-epimerase